MGSRVGVLKIAAKRIGISFEEYMENLVAGLKWCTGCQGWRQRKKFWRNKAKSDGLGAYCSECQAARYTIKRVGTKERRQKRVLGLYWCKRCEGWVSEDLMVFGSNKYSSGLCREHYNAAQREQYKKNPEKRRKAYLYAKAQRELRKPIPIDEKRRLLELFGGLCAYCGERPFENWEYFRPVHSGGKSKVGNILPACKRCNSSKGTRDAFRRLRMG